MLKGGENQMIWIDLYWALLGLNIGLIILLTIKRFLLRPTHLVIELRGIEVEMPKKEIKKKTGKVMQIKRVKIKKKKRR